jgi:hypothetical protein
MAFASLSDVNKHYPDDKFYVQDADIPEPGIYADRLIRARLGGIVDTDIIALWVSPDTTPEIVREVSGLLVAAKLYAEAAAEDEADGSAYAQSLYDEAMRILDEIREGVSVIIGVDEIPIDTTSIEGSFWPDNTTQPSFFKVADQWS